MRLNCIDHYQSTPTKFDPPLTTDQDGLRGQVPKVPVIRVFGSTETGQKVCAHVHGAFPYLYIEYQESLISEDGKDQSSSFRACVLTPASVESYIYRLHLTTEQALAVSYRRNLLDGRFASVAHISLVKGVPFYGYHVGYRFFLKIYLFNPLHIVRLADLLRQGAIMSRAIQPYESHMQYIPQWMCDYNLFGCEYMDCSEVIFRSPVPGSEEDSNALHKWHDRSIPALKISDETEMPRQSHCSVEVDVCVQDILNRQKIKQRPLHHDFTEKSNAVLDDEKLLHSMAGLWKDETKRRKVRMGIVDPGSSPFPPEALVTMSADLRNTQPGGWIHEEEYRELIHTLVEQERDSPGERNASFENFVESDVCEESIKTVFESIEDLFPSNLAKIQRIRGLQNAKGDNDQIAAETIDIDKNRILSLHDDGVAAGFDQEGGSEADTLSGSPNAPAERKDPLDEATETPNDHIQVSDGKDSENFTAAIKLEPEGTEYKRDRITNLQNMGIRTAGDFKNTLDDMFAFDSDFASEISSAVARYQQAEVTDTFADPPRKRRKLNDERRPSQSKPSSSQTEQTSESDSENLPKSPNYSTEAVARLDHTSSPREAPLDLQSRSTYANGDKKLPFAVVKSPSDHLTIERLSQQSNPSSKSSEIVNGDNSATSKNKSLPNGGLACLRADPLTPSQSSSEVSSKLTNVLSTIHKAFPSMKHSRVLFVKPQPPQQAQATAFLRESAIPSVKYQDAHYGDEDDVPERGREYAGKEFKLESTTVPYLPDFNAKAESEIGRGLSNSSSAGKAYPIKSHKRPKRHCTLRTWEFERPPPTWRKVENWLVEESVANLRIANHGFNQQSAGHTDSSTQRNKHGFKYSQKQTETSVSHEKQYMSVMSLEVHVNTRAHLRPDPEKDEISCIFWSIQSDEKSPLANDVDDGARTGIAMLAKDDGSKRKISSPLAAEIHEESSELDLINHMVDVVRTFDPDVLTGFEVHNASWGYLIERARYRYDFNLCDEFSRMKSQSHGRFGRESDQWGFNQTSTIRVTGRHMINIWRAMRSELNLLQYTMENVAFHTLHRRVPHYSFQDLTRSYTSNRPRDVLMVLEYYVSRVRTDLDILEQNELIPRTSEQARLLGVDFFSVFSRGSQFKVESLMFRIAKPENFILVSPSRKQVGQQNALECLPLVMEPQSAFYTSPLLVLDFQSLYPSVMIAYNYCYSTFLGRITHWRGQNKMGFKNFAREKRLLELLKDHINIAPNGMMYARPNVRKSLLAKMLGEILETRVMVKSGMKVDKQDKTLQRLLNNRQLALKLIANVTYGYTSASFSGRMPCAEIADSIVQTGRETLEKAIALIHSVERWGAEVVYGDTDSLFVYLKGRTRDEAFDIGAEIAKAVTDINPRPVKLKFEKAYQPCVLLAKKRYVGFKYESKTQKEPGFDAKGIETVRRDGTPAEQRIEEKALKILFRTADLSQVKSYFQSQCMKIMKGKISIQDFCFAREVKLGTYSNKGPPPPGALISTRRMLEDPRSEPQYGERVPYVVIAGAPGARLIDRCVAPEVLLQNDQNELDAEYYISKNLIPPLERIFNLVGANVRQWYEEMPKYQRIRKIDTNILTEEKELGLLRRTLESYMKSSTCIICRDRLDAGFPVCNSCLGRSKDSLLALRLKLNAKEAKQVSIEKICRSCANIPFGDSVRCDSKDCPVFYDRTRHKAGLSSYRAMSIPLMKMLEEANPNALDW